MGKNSKGFKIGEKQKSKNLDSTGGPGSYEVNEGFRVVRERSRSA